MKLQRIALRAHQEARQAMDLRGDLARRVMPSDGPYAPGDKVFFWHKDESKKKAEGAWIRAKVVSQEGAMVTVQTPKAIHRVNQSKVRRDHDEWHDVAIPLDPPKAQEKESSEANFCCEHEVCYHMLESGKCDFLEIAPVITGVSAQVSRESCKVAPPVIMGDLSKKKLIAYTWKVLESSNPDHVLLYAEVPDAWKPDKVAQRNFFSLCYQVFRWQVQRGKHATVVASALAPVWFSQRMRTVTRMSEVHSSTTHLGGYETWIVSNCVDGAFERMKEIQGTFVPDLGCFDARFVVAFTTCLLGRMHSDFRQSCLVEDLLEDMSDGQVCGLCLCADRSGEAYASFPRMNSTSAGNTLLPRPLRFVLPQRFVTISLVQTLRHIDGLRPGVELEIHTSDSKDASSLRSQLKNVRMMTLPHLEFEHCSVYRFTEVR